MRPVCLGVWVTPAAVVGCYQSNNLYWNKLGRNVSSPKPQLFDSGLAANATIVGTQGQGFELNTQRLQLAPVAGHSARVSSEDVG
jgi:hypothetical protein